MFTPESGKAPPLEVSHLWVALNHWPHWPFKNVSKNVACFAELWWLASIQRGPFILRDVEIFLSELTSRPRVSVSVLVSQQLLWISSGQNSFKSSSFSSDSICSGDPAGFACFSLQQESEVELSKLESVQRCTKHYKTISTSPGHMYRIGISAVTLPLALWRQSLETLS